MSWKRQSTRILLKHPRIVVSEDIVELPSGHQTDYIRIESNRDAATIIPQDATGKILIQKEYSYPPDEYLYQFPGGALESGESPSEGAARELAEEANLCGSLQEIGWFYPDNRRKAQRMFVFLATDLKPAVGQKDTEESFEDFWHTSDEICAMIRTNTIRNYSALAAWAYYTARSQD